MKNGFLDGLAGTGEPSGSCSSGVTAEESRKSSRGQGSRISWRRTPGELSDQCAEPPNEGENAQGRAECVSQVSKLFRDRDHC
ncbi:unnamed protein product [Penicillium roqueforti FM164]|uniref:Genomic scaffold, ProqFM164S02 n=1 Tax=Penicillium roqueforti (strain FM164) TaxID=1365484 RepID=W6QFP5_PENRF|nr:unnamed protein product [Penicillium roqueforti FM164]